MKKRESAFSDREKVLIRELQGDIPLVPAPFDCIGEKAGFSEDELLGKIKKWREEGLIRRFGAVLSHYQAGIASNVMIVWKVPKNRSQEVGKTMASFSQVSHCYERPVFSEWPYNLFTMVHAGSRDECRQIAQDIADKTGIKDYRLLFSTKEYKKSSMAYFNEAGQ